MHITGVQPSSQAIELRMFMPLPIEFDLDILLVQGQHCLNVGLRDMKVTLHDVCGGPLASKLVES